MCSAETVENADEGSRGSERVGGSRNAGDLAEFERPAGTAAERLGQLQILLGQVLLVAAGQQAQFQCRQLDHLPERL